APKAGGEVATGAVVGLDRAAGGDPAFDVGIAGRPNIFERARGRPAVERGRIAAVIPIRAAGAPLLKQGPVGREFCGEIGVVAFVDEVGERQLVDAGEQAGHDSCYTFGETVTRPVLLAAPLCRVAEAGTRAPAVGRAVGSTPEVDFVRLPARMGHPSL